MPLISDWANDFFCTGRVWNRKPDYGRKIVRQQQYQILVSTGTQQGRIFLKAHTSNTKHWIRMSSTDAFQKSTRPAGKMMALLLKESQKLCPSSLISLTELLPSPYAVHPTVRHSLANTYVGLHPLTLEFNAKHAFSSKRHIFVILKKSCLPSVLKTNGIVPYFQNIRYLFHNNGVLQWCMFTIKNAEVMYFLITFSKNSHPIPESESPPKSNNKGPLH